jgi:hypothetical protein
MRYIYPLLCFFFLSGIAKSQDLLVTIDGDSLNCKIIQQNAQFIIFTQTNAAGMEMESTLPLDAVRNFEIGFFASEEQKDYYNPEAADTSFVRMPGGDEGQEEQGSREALKPTKRYRLAVSGGLAYRLAKVESGMGQEVDDYLNDLKSGSTYGGSISFITRNDLMFGLSLNWFNSRNSLGIFLEDAAGNVIQGNMSDQISLFHIAPHIGMRYLLANGKSQVYYAFSIGYTKYVNEAVFIEPFTITAETLELGAETGIDFFLTDALSAGIGLSFITGGISDFEIEYPNGDTESIELEEPEGLLRVNLFAGIRFLF